MPNDTSADLACPPATAPAFDAAAWTQELLDLNPWAKPFIVDGKLIDIVIEEGHPIPDHGLDAQRRTFCEARKEACVARWRPCVRNPDGSVAAWRNGKASWNGWAERMEVLRLNLETAGLWDVGSSELGQQISDVPQTLLWLFCAQTDFSDSWLLEEAYFSHFIFPNGANFNRTRFGAPDEAADGYRGDALFKWARFNRGPALFDRARFNGGHASFTGARFNGGYASFRQSRFNGGDTFFYGAQFNGGHASFDEARFNGGDAWFVEAQFNGGYVSFNAARFSGGHASFLEVQFNGGDAFFAMTRFNGGDAQFDSARFRRSFTLSNAIAAKRTTLNDVRITGRFEASQMQSKGSVEICRAAFANTTEFAAFHSKVGFTLADSQFAEVPDFIDAVFHEPPRLDNVTIAEPLGPQSSRGADENGGTPFSTSNLDRWIDDRAGALAGSMRFNELKHSGDQLRDILSNTLRELRTAFRSGHQYERWIDGKLPSLTRLIERSKGAPSKDTLRDWLSRHAGRRLQPRWSRGFAIARDPDAAAKFRKLKKMAMEAEDHDREMEFHAQEIRCRRFWEDYPSWNGRGVTRFWLGWIYGGLSDFGRSIVRPLAALGVQAVLFAGLYLTSWMGRPVSSSASFVPVTTTIPNDHVGRVELGLRMLLDVPTAIGRWLWSHLPSGSCAADQPGTSLGAVGEALYFSFKNSFVFIDWDRAETAKRVFGCLYGIKAGEPTVPTLVSFVSTAQIVVAAVLIFLLLLGVRNMLKLN